MKRKATFHNGEPANLPAAAMDALEWCEWLRKHLNHCLLDAKWNEERRRLSLAIEALKKQLGPHLPPRFTATELPAAFVLDEGKDDASHAHDN